MLPALPHQWPSGSLKGVRVRAGGKLDIEWKDGRLTMLRMQADHPQDIVWSTVAAQPRSSCSRARQSSWTACFMMPGDDCERIIHC